MRRIKLGNKVISDTSSPYIIAEIGVNHEGSLEKAKELISLAKEGGADAAKFQSYKASRLASKNSPSYWDLSKESTTSQFKLFKKYDNFVEDDYIKLYEHCVKEDIDFLSTPFDENAVEYLDKIVPFFKVASADLTNYPLLKKIAMKNKPVVLSTGASSIDEVSSSVNYLIKNNGKSIALLHCILNYPTADDNANLAMITDLREKFEKNVIGYSDHTLPSKNMSSLIISYILGARVIEKHFTNDKTLKGNDHYHAMDINDLKNFKLNLKKTRELIGDLIYKQPIPSEVISRENARRSIVLTKNVKANHIITESDICCKRPGTGISPIHWNEVLGKKIKTQMEEDDLLQWSHLL